MRKNFTIQIIIFMFLSIGEVWGMGFSPKGAPVIDRAYMDYIIPFLVFGLFPLLYAILRLLSRSEKHKGEFSEVFLVFFFYLLFNMTVWLFLKKYNVANRELLSVVLLVSSGFIIAAFGLLKFVLFKRSLKIDSIKWNCPECGVSNSMTQVCWQCGSPRKMESSK